MHHSVKDQSSATRFISHGRRPWEEVIHTNTVFIALRSDTSASTGASDINPMLFAWLFGHGWLSVNHGAAERHHRYLRGRVYPLMTMGELYFHEVLVISTHPGRGESWLLCLQGNSDLMIAIGPMRRNGKR